MSLDQKISANNPFNVNIVIVEYLYISSFSFQLEIFILFQIQVVGIKKGI